MKTLPLVLLGKTGITVSRIGLGLAALGRPGYINIGHSEDLANNYVIDAMRGRTHRMLDLAYQQGVRYFDAARSYGRAEEFLLSWLKEKKAEDVVIGSKWGYIYTAEWKTQAEQHEIKKHEPEILEQQWEISSQLLPYLKLYQIHSATFESGVLENTEVLNRLAALKQAGVAIGLTLSGDNQANVLEAAMMIRIDGVYLFDTVQATFNILEQSIGESLAKAADAGMGIIIKEALANGRLTVRNDAPEFAATRKVLDDIANPLEVGLDALALAFVLSRPWAHVVLSGAAVEAHLLSNLSAAHIQLDSNMLEALDRLKEDPYDYWQTRKRLKWN